MSIAPNSTSPGSLAGIPAYVEQLQSPLFWRAVVNTLYYAGVYVPCTLFFGYLLARLVQKTLRPGRYLIFLFIIPAMLPPVSSGVLWRWVYGPEVGLIDTISRTLGGPMLDLLNQPHLVLPCIALVNVWQSTGLVAVIFLAAMVTVPREYEELAQLDGARGMRRLLHVSVPSVGSALRVSLLLLLVNSHRVFTPIYVITRDGGPSNWSTTLPFLVYRRAMFHAPFDFQGAAALSTMLCFTIIIMVMLLFRSPLMRDEES